MKVSSSKPENDFEPFDLTIRFETEEEAKQFFFLFAFTPLTDVCDELNDSEIRSAMLAVCRVALDGVNRLRKKLLERTAGGGF